MAIKRIKVRNFKSFRNLDLRLGDLNILIGANAAGKSNFVDIFRFLWDIKNSGLENAISLRGGIEYLRNINIGSSKELSLDIVSDQEFSFGKISEWVMAVYETTYGLTIEFDDGGSSFKIVRDRVKHKFRFSKLVQQGNEVIEEETGPGEAIFSNGNGKVGKFKFNNIVKRGRKEIEEEIGQGEVTISNINGKVEVVDLALPNLPEGVSIEKDDILPKDFVSEELPPGTPLLSVPFFSMMARPLGYNISIYDFARGIVRDAVSMAAKAELEKNGSNLAVVLKNIMSKEDGKRKLLNLVSYLLPFVNDLTMEKLADKFLLLKLQEIYSDQYLPGLLASDGTIDMITLIVALYFEKQPLAIIEEPERGIHPHLQRRCVHRRLHSTPRLFLDSRSLT